PEHYPATLYKDERIAGWRDNYVYKLPSGEIVAIYQDVTERKQAEEALRHRVGELAVLQETVLDITGRHDLPELLNSIVERAARLLGATSGGMYLCDSEKQEARCVVSYNTATNTVGTVIKYGEGAAGIVAATGKPLIIDDYRTWPGRAAIYEKDQPFSSVLSAPMIWQGQVTGVIHVLDNKEARHFTQADLELLALFANHAAIALENQRSLVALRENEEKYRAMVEDSPNFIGIFQDGVLKYVNSVAVLDLGWTREELLSPSFDPIENAVSEKSRSVLKENITRRLRGERVAPYEISLTKKDGSQIPVMVRAAKITYHQRPAIEFVFDDITERKKYETRLLALHTHASQLSSAEEGDTIVKCTLDALEFTFGFEHADFLLVENGSLQIKGSRGTPLAFSAQPLEGRGTTVKAANTKTTLRISDTRKEPAYVDPKGYDWTGPPTVLSELVVPVLLDAEAVAVLCVDSIRLDAFSDEDQELLETLAIHVGSALGRLRHEEELETIARFPSENPAPILRLDRHGTVLSANEASKALLQDWRSGIGQAAPMPWRDLVTDVLSSEEGRNIDIELRGKSYTFLVKPIVEENYVNLYGTDITDRKRAEEKLRQSEERYRSLFDRMLDGMYRSTHEGRFVDVNPTLAKMFGYSSKQEMLDIMDIKKELYFSPEERGSHILDTGQEEVEVYRMRRRDGSEVWVEDHGGYVHDEQGNIIYHEGILRDVTQRKQLEEELKQYSAHLEELVKERSGKLAESEARYRRLFEGSPISLWEEDFSEVKKYLDDLRSRGIRNLRRYFIEHPEDLAKCATMVKILDVNEATLRLYGAKTVEELGGELGRVFTHEFHDRFREELVALGEGKTQFASEFDNQTLAGDTKHVSLILSVIPGYEDTLAKVLVSTIDLTERKEMEQRLQQAERLAAVGETAAMVGHDLRNPLQGIAGAVHLLKQEALTAKERDEMLRLIEDSVGYSDAIVGDLTEYSAEIKLNLIETTPKSIVREALAKVSVPGMVTVHDRSEERPTIKVDSDRMTRVFINLVDNAIDAMPQGGILTISGKQSDGSMEIEFSDTGSGMPEKVMKNLWKPLQTTKAKGLGLGLAICKRVVDAHGGSISVKSIAGEGTIVTIRLPIKPDAAEVTQE
ncbi:MAG: PAS domain S-box protein, partial [Candidatus Bathyarchaeia archaeon]